MKHIEYMLMILLTVILSSCAPIHIRPVFINPTPLAVYHKKDVLVSAGVGAVGNAVAGNLEFQKVLDKNNGVDLGTMVNLYSSKSEGLSSNEVYGFVRKWLKEETRENPYANLYLGLKLAKSDFEKVVEGYNYLYSAGIDAGLSLGVFRKNFNLAFVLRAGAGVTEPAGSYYYGGLSPQTVFFVDKNLGVNLELNFLFGVGQTKGAGIIAFPQLARLSLVYRF